MIAYHHTADYLELSNKCRWSKGCNPGYGREIWILIIQMTLLLGMRITADPTWTASDIATSADGAISVYP